MCGGRGGLVGGKGRAGGRGRGGCGWCGRAPHDGRAGGRHAAEGEGVPHDGRMTGYHFCQKKKNGDSHSCKYTTKICQYSEKLVLVVHWYARMTVS